MAIESHVNFRRLAHAGLCAAFAMLSVAGVSRVAGIAGAQTYPAPPPVATGSIVPLQHTQYGQIYSIRVAPTGDVVFLDVSESAIYQMKAGTNQFSQILSGSPLGPATGYQNEGLAMDAKGTLYIGARYPPYENTAMLRIPYDPTTKTWDNITAASDDWGTNVNFNGAQISSTEMTFIDSPQKDGSGTVLIGTQGGNAIVAVPVNADGTIPLDSKGNPQSQVIVTGLGAPALRLATDQNSNIYFIEDPINGEASRANGIFFIAAGSWVNQPCGHATDSSNAAGCVVGNSQGTAETNPIIQRIDPASNTGKYSGLTIDGNGNIILTDQVDGHGGQTNGVFLIPNESGSAASVTAASAFNWGHLRYLSPVSSNASPTLDPRGFLWIPTFTSGWSPGGENPVPGTDNFVLWQFGGVNVGPSPVGTASPTSTVYYSFTSAVTPAAIGFVGDDASDFSVVTTDPNPVPNANPPAAPCLAGTAYTPITSCPVWLASTPLMPGVEGSELAMSDGSGNVIGGSVTYASTIGEGPAVSLLVPSAVTPIASGLKAPAQVATDSLGNTYVADPGLGQVLEFPAGTSSATAGTPIGTGLAKPTGVGVDPAGDVYIADSGKVIEIPMGANGKLNAAGQSVLISSYNGTKPFSNNVQLATDAEGDVFVADATNAVVVKIPDPQFIFNGPVPLEIGSGFKNPTAIAVDNSGDVFVADGSTLSEVTQPFGGQSSITKNLAAPVTGLAVDPSGSIDVAQSGGVVRIPFENGTYNTNDQTALASSITAPQGIAIDPAGNLYVSDTTQGSPNLFQLSLNAFVNFGQVGPYVTTDPIEVDVFDIGNEPLSFTAAPTFSGPAAADAEYALVAAPQSGCDTTGKTPVAPGSSCALDVTLTATDIGARTASMTVPTNALNAPGAVANLTGTGAGNLCYTITTFTLSPTTGIGYPGTTTASVNVTLNTTPPNGQSNPAGCTAAPSGTATMTLTPQGGGQAFTFSGTLVQGPNSSTTTIPAIDLPGGTYSVKVTYKGSTQFFGGSTAPVTLTVSPVTPTVTLTEPSGVTPINGTYYVPLGSDTRLEAAVISSVGTPSGTVSFVNMTTGNPADSKQVNLPLNADGQATFNTDNLPAGTYTIAAKSNSTGTDPNFTSATSNQVTFQVVGSSALITASPASMTTTAGTPATSTLTIQGLAGYAGDSLQLSCINSTLPQYSECTFTVPTLNLKTSPISQSVLSISTDVPVNVGQVKELRTTGAPVFFAGAFGLGLLGLAARKRRKFRSAIGTLCLLMLLCGATAGMTGCTNSGYTHTPAAPHYTTPPGTYTVQVIGTDPNLGVVTLPFTISLTVNAAK
jgi:sugar lactone lactonase YvrE